MIGAIRGAALGALMWAAMFATCCGLLAPETVAPPVVEVTAR